MIPGVTQREPSKRQRTRPGPTTPAGGSPKTFGQMILGAQADGELTPTLKVNRALVYDKYADVFAGLYAEGSRS